MVNVSLISEVYVREFKTSGLKGKYIAGKSSDAGTIVIMAMNRVILYNMLREYLDRKHPEGSCIGYFDADGNDLGTYQEALKRLPPG